MSKDLMKLKVLFTGSEGNCSLFSYKDTNILIDAGFKTNKKMQEILGETLESIKIDGIIVTHEHNDHFSPWTGRLCIDNKIKLYVHERHIKDEETRKTKYLSNENKKIGETYHVDYELIKEGEPFVIKDLRIDPFTAFHDANKTLGFVINKTFGYLSDCGYISNNIKRNLLDVTSLALEFNYDIESLINSSRHYTNKIRTMGKFGHLSNEEGIKFCEWLVEKGNLNTVITLHPSNSHCDLAGLEENLKKINIKSYVSSREKNDEIVL
ncbi:MAG: MBL fold metallo-hydrolase [Fusobacteriaceae bacterium]